MSRKIKISLIAVLLAGIFIFVYFIKILIIFNGGSEYKSLISKYSSLYGVDQMLVRAVMKRESNVNPNAVSNKGAIGLMQIMPKTGEDIARNLKINDFKADMLKNADTNIMFGVYYLKKLLERYDNDYILALGAYNAGISNIDVVFFVNANERISAEDMPFNETARHVKAIMITYQFYKGEEKLKGILKLTAI